MTKKEKQEIEKIIERLEAKPYTAILYTVIYYMKVMK